jgi:hypothetical protein
MSSIATTEPCIAQLDTTPFRWGWDSNQWIFHYLWRPPQPTHLLLHQKLTKPPGSLSGYTRFRIFYRSRMPSTSNVMINPGCHIIFRWAKKFGCTCRKNALQGPIRSFAHSEYGPYTITKDVGDNAFALTIPPFVGMHPVSKVALLRPYFPPLLDTSEIAEKLTPTELNPDCMKHASSDQIVDTQIKGTQQQRIHLYRVVKVGQLLQQGKWLTRGQIQQKFTHLMGELNAMEAIAS